MITESSKKDKLKELNDVIGTPSDGDILVYDSSTDTHQYSPLITEIKNVDGSGSGLDADLLDGYDSSYFATDADLSSHTSNTSNPHSTTISNLTDVDTAGIADEKILKYNSTSGKWEIGDAGGGTAAEISTDTTNFDNILSSTEDTVQKALDVLDDHTHSYYLRNDQSGSIENGTTSTLLTLGNANSSSGPHGINFGNNTSSDHMHIYFRTSPQSLSFENDAGSKLMEIPLSGSPMIGGNTIWHAGNISGHLPIYVSSTAPSSPYQGMLWQDTSVNSNLIYIKYYDGSAWRIHRKIWVTDTTINISSTTDFDNFLSLINYSTILDGIIVTGQFADGTYTISSTKWIYTSGNGTLRLYGNSSDFTASENKSVVLDGSGQDLVYGTLNFNSGSSILDMQGIEVRAKTNTTNTMAVMVDKWKGHIYNYYNSFKGNSASYGYGFRTRYCSGIVRLGQYYVGNILIGASFDYSASAKTLYGYSGTTKPTYGIRAKFTDVHDNGTHPSGATQDLVTTEAEIY